MLADRFSKHWAQQLFSFTAERRQSMGNVFHPDCLKCQECGKILKPGQHAEVHFKFYAMASQKIVNFLTNDATEAQAE